MLAYVYPSTLDALLVAALAVPFFVVFFYFMAADPTGDHGEEEGHRAHTEEPLKKSRPPAKGGEPPP